MERWLKWGLMQSEMATAPTPGNETLNRAYFTLLWKKKI